jgi:thiamine-monophosphate kinase
VRLSELGEFGLIDRIARRTPRGHGVVLGIGDDAAVLRLRRGEDLVLSTDSLVEGVHFRLATQSARSIGRRALAVNLSDLAAMGARPVAFTAALVAPPDLEVRWLDGLVAGLLAEAARFACPLVGGNLSRGRELSIAIAVTGALGRGRALTRAAARAGDRVFVTGTLGGSALELARAERGLGRVRRVPLPRLAAGRALARLPSAGACIDVSDGLEADLGHLLDASGVDAEIDAARVPRPRGFDAACRRLSLDPERLVLAGGEDYELLFTVRPGGPPAARLAARLRVPVAQIGRIVPRRGRRRAASGGFRHF